MCLLVYLISNNAETLIHHWGNLVLGGNKETKSLACDLCHYEDGVCVFIEGSSVLS